MLTRLCLPFTGERNHACLWLWVGTLSRSVYKYLFFKVSSGVGCELRAQGRVKADQTVWTGQALRQGDGSLEKGQEYEASWRALLKQPGKDLQGASLASAAKCWPTFPAEENL